MTLSAEDQLVLFLARGKLASRVQKQARALLAKPLDWQLILHRTMAEEVYPVFYRNLQAVGRESVYSVCCDGPKTQEAEGAESKELRAKGKGQRAPFTFHI